ncbi:hypothetical protein NX059_005959 [Plenodomus lindquistii]|nr:hypothetical protein NX059_005959 [Plenodomus lindquistii]
MRFSSAALLASTFLATSASARFVMYADEWHPTRPTDPADRAGIDHVVLAFAMANATAQFQPKVPISTIRSEFPNAKVMIAVGGWGDDIGFAEASRSDATIAKFASDVATMLTNTGADGVDIDWEYPGGNGADYKQVPNSEKTYQIDAYPKTLAALRTAVGDKLISIAVPGKKGDMIGFTSETGPKIWPSVDYINVMSYDLANRRDTVTKHHSSVAGSEDTIKNYLAIGAPPSKINLGFAYYAKYFTTQGDCTASPLGCPIVAAEDPITGKDLLTSGAWTFEPAHMKPVDSSSLPISYDGTCGPDKGTKCASGCCSQYGNCGTSTEHCSGACWHAFGTGCTDNDVAGSWQLAAKNGVTDEKEGGQYYFDKTNQLFWTWDTPDLISAKFENIVRKYKLGGVMAWSLGEDSYDWSHIHQMASELQRTSSGDSPRPGQGQPMQPALTPAATFDDASGQYVPVTTSHRRTRPRPTRRPQPSPSSSPYAVVFVDGTDDGPSAQPSNAPGSPSDFTVDFNGEQAVKPTTEDISPGPIPIQPYVDPDTPPAEPTYAPPPAPEETKPFMYIDPILPIPVPVESESVSPPSPIGSITAPAPAPEPTRLTQPYEPDFVPDPGYVNPNWHPEAVSAPAAAPVVSPAAVAEGSADRSIVAPIPAVPVQASEDDENEDGATWAHPIGVAHERGKAKACRVKRHKRGDK